MSLHKVELWLDESEQPQTVHELADTLKSWVDGPIPAPVPTLDEVRAEYNAVLLNHPELAGILRPLGMELILADR